MDEDGNFTNRGQPDPETELTLTPGHALGSLSKLEQEILRTASEARTLSRVLDMSSELDIEIARCVARLLEAGVLAPIRPGETLPD